MKRLNNLNKLCRNSVNLVRNYTKNQTLEEQCKKEGVIETLQNLNLSDLKTRSIDKLNGIGIHNILIYGPLRLTVYYLPTGQTMKLHDHPSMEVVNFVIKGKMEERSYTHLSNNIYKKEVSILQIKSIKFIDGCVSKQGNLHEFLGIQPTYFLDIIFPDYDQKRVCKFFSEKDSNTCELVEIPAQDIDFFQF